MRGYYLGEKVDLSLRGGGVIIWEKVDLFHYTLWGFWPNGDY